MLFINNVTPYPESNYFLIFCTLSWYYKKNRPDVYSMLKHSTWILWDGRDDVCICPVTVLYQIHYINSYVHFYLLIDGYSIFLSLRCTIYYPRNMSTYDVFSSISSTYVSTLGPIPYLFYPILTTFPTHSLAEGSPICRVSIFFRTVIT